MRFKPTDSLWLLNDDGKLVTVQPTPEDQEGFVAFICLEEGTLFIVDCGWNPEFKAAHIPLNKLWAVEDKPVHIFTSHGKGNASVQTITKEEICGRAH